MNLLAPISLWGFGAGFLAVTCEYLFRVLPGSYWQNWWVYFPLGVLINYMVYKIVITPATSLIDALIVFTFSTAVCRVIVSVAVLGDDIRAGTWAALVLVIIARIVQVVWR